MVDKKHSGNGTFQAKPVCLISFSWKRLFCLAGAPECTAFRHQWHINSSPLSSRRWRVRRGSREWRWATASARSSRTKPSVSGDGAALRSALASCPFRVAFSFSYEAFTSTINVDQANYHTLDLWMEASFVHHLKTCPIAGTYAHCHWHVSLCLQRLHCRLGSLQPTGSSRTSWCTPPRINR